MNQSFFVSLGLSLLLLLTAVGCQPTFHPADRVDADGDGFFAPAPGLAIDGKIVCDYAELASAGDDDDSSAGDDDDSSSDEDLVEAECLGMDVLLSQGIDCDDGDDDRFPGAAELCDGEDNDCDNQLSDEEDDADGDGYSECGYLAATGELSGERDCNDLPGEGIYQNPGLVEICGMLPVEGLEGPGIANELRPEEGLDDDCDGTTVIAGEVDRDQDGHADACELLDLVAHYAGAEPVPLALDCNDNDPAINPSIGAEGTPAASIPPTCWTPEVATNCEETTEADQVLWYPDLDRDGDGDANPSSWVGLCSGTTPDGFVDNNWIEDLNGPDLGQENHTDCDDNDDRLEGLDQDEDGVSTCSAPAGDCDDQNALVFPGASELCDALDNDCEGDIDEDFDVDGDGAFYDDGTASDTCLATYGQRDCDDTDDSLNYLDDDGDGAHTCDFPPDCDDRDSSVTGEDGDLDGFSTCEGDCDDNDPEMHPDDLDGDGVSPCGLDGVAGSPDDDCDDNEPTRYPGAPHLCDGEPNNDCDFFADPNEADYDGDGFNLCGDDLVPASGDEDCDDLNGLLNLDDNDGDGFSSCGGDCTDTDTDRFPGAPHLCDGQTDNDCNGSPDPNEADQDNDGSTICDGDCNDFDDTVEALDIDTDGFSTCEGDCDDNSSALSPGVDNDLDSWPTCGTALGPADCDDADASANFSDVDGDGSTSCGPDGVAASGDEDCDDLDINANLLDGDSDGQTTCGGDCDDGNSSILSGEPEVLDGLDNDCSGVADQGLLSAGALAFTELMIAADPVTNDAYGEYVEVINTLSHDIDLRGWEVIVTSDASSGASQSWTFDSDPDPSTSLLIGPSERVVLARSTNSLGYGTEIADYHWSAAGFSEVGGSVSLVFGGIPIDSVTWSGSGCTSGCEIGGLSPTYGGPGFWRVGFAMGLADVWLTGTEIGNAHTHNDDENKWCEEQDALGSNQDHGSPGTSPATIGPCGS